MAVILSPQSELDAVNQMLRSIGQTPVNTLEVSGIGDVADARAYLTDTLRSVSAAGWSWNTNRNFTLTPDASGEIALPIGVLDVDAEDRSANIVVRRNPTTGNMALWDADSNTFTFTGSVSVTTLLGIPFDDLPQTARTYVTALAARRFQGTKISSAVLDKVNQDEVDSAWLLLMRGERRTRDTNLFRTNTTVNSFGNRRRF